MRAWINVRSVLRQVAVLFGTATLTSVLALPPSRAQDAPLLPANPATCTALGTTCNATTFQISAPCKITTSGHYTLTQSFQQTSTTGDGIDVTVPNVTIDLSGYRLKGPGSGNCVGINTCSSSSACNDHATVRNGSVTNFGGPGIQLGTTGITTPGTGSFVFQVRAVGNGIGSNGGGGIVLGDQSMAIDDIASGNGNSITGDGIDCGISCIVHGNVVVGNVGNGIVTGTYASAMNNVESGSHTGINNGTSSGYGKNVMDNNSTGDKNSGTQLCGNICSGSICSGGNNCL